MKGTLRERVERENYAKSLLKLNQEQYSESDDESDAEIVVKLKRKV